MKTRAIGRVLNILSGVILLGIGLYFIFFRPAFLPEDMRYIGTAQSIDELLPRLGLWLHRVFIVLGGFIFSTGLLVVGFSFAHFQEGHRRAVNIFLICTWAASIGTMTLINFSIGSDFKWPLAMMAILWLTGIILSAIKPLSFKSHLGIPGGATERQSSHQALPR